jgi:MOSC domain-containing protein YiiM
MPEASLLAVHTGKIAPLGPDGEPSGFIKTPRQGRVAVRYAGLEGDEQADLSVHGGVDKAVYAYSADRYPAWRAEFPALADRFRPGSMGENLSVTGMVEDDLCIGDIHQIGTAQLQICQPRRPCFKFSLAFNNSLLPKAMVRNGYAGWYYRVIAEGQVAAGDSVRLIARPHKNILFSKIVAILNSGGPSREDFVLLRDTAALAQQWRDIAARKLAE